jgi:hypothetical protein
LALEAAVAALPSDGDRNESNDPNDAKRGMAANRFG